MIIWRFNYPRPNNCRRNGWFLPVFRGCGNNDVVLLSRRMRPFRCLTSNHLKFPFHRVIVIQSVTCITRPARIRLQDFQRQSKVPDVLRRFTTSFCLADIGRWTFTACPEELGGFLLPDIKMLRTARISSSVTRQ